MKLEIYEPHLVGYVKTDPYEWEYDGRYQEVVDYLDSEPTVYGAITVDADDDEIADGEVELSGEDYLRRIGKELLKRRVWDCMIVDG